MITEKGEVTISYLLIQNADLADSGKYSCSPSNADVASVRVHVLNGKTLGCHFCYRTRNINIIPSLNACYLSLLQNYFTTRQNLSLPDLLF